MPTDVPNGVVMRGPRGNPILVDYEDDGKMSNSGTEVEIGEWLPGMSKSIPGDVIILVHSVRGEKEVLIKSLAINQIDRDGNKLTVAQLAKSGTLPGLVEKLRGEFISCKKDHEGRTN
jgi:hypothetical protein